MVETSEALEWLRKKHEAEAKEPGQPKEEAEKQTETKEPEPKSDETSTVQTEVAEKKEEPVIDGKEPEAKDEKPEQTEDKPDESKTEKSDTRQVDKKDKDIPPRQKYSREERIAHKFAKQNEKLRERGETIRKQQETIENLNKELEKYKGLTLEDFDNNVGAYADWKAKEASMQNEVKFRSEMMENAQREAAEIETARREELSFEDEDERYEYREMLRTHGPNFYDALQKADADYLHPNGKGEIAKTVLNYLSTVDKYPVVLRELMDLKTGALRRVFNGSKDPEIIKSNLHQLTQELLSEQKTVPQAKSVAQEKPAAKPLPVIGKQVVANSKPTAPVHDRAYWTNYAKIHP